MLGKYLFFGAVMLKTTGNKATRVMYQTGKITDYKKKNSDLKEDKTNSLWGTLDSGGNQSQRAKIWIFSS